MPIDPILIGGLIIVAIVVVIVMVRQRGDSVTTVKMPSTPLSHSNAPSDISSAGDLAGQVHSLIARNQRIQAVKRVREHTGLGLKEAKDYVEAIERGLSCVQAGAQGEHKLARGYEPVRTLSAHFLPDPGFRAAVARFLEGERDAVNREIEWAREQLPYRSDSSS